MKLEVFIGSSSESLNVANATKRLLDSDDIACTVWDKDSFFRLSSSNIDNLSASVNKFDAGIFVFAEDDKLSSRGIDLLAPRDNVIFEHGLFCGHLGPRRTFVLRAKTRKLKWLSDLEGFTPAEYDPDLAKSNAEAAVEKACELLRNELRQLSARPGIYVGGDCKQLGSDWWTYPTAETCATVLDGSSLEVVSPDWVGLRFPRHDNLNAVGRYCACRLARTSNDSDGHFYFFVTAQGERIYLSLAESHSEEGWGKPRNEFMLRLPHLEVGRYVSLLVDLESLAPFVGPISSVNGFRLRPGLKVSHICVCNEIPFWLKEARPLYPSSAPLIAIEKPLSDSVVDREQLVEGSVRNLQKASIGPNDIQVFVLAPDSFWYPQGNLTLTSGRWQVKAYFGDEERGAGADFRLAVVTTNGQPLRDKTKELPIALARSVVRVTRRA